MDREKELIEKKLIPLDKSWIIRMGILDIIHGKKTIIDFLHSQNNLGDDLLALKRAAEVWETNDPVDVGESGTLYRLLKYVSWKLNLNKEFIISGTLKNRNITNDSSIVNMSLNELLKLDKGTSQWATASVLLENEEKIEHPPYKLQLTYEAVDHWNLQDKKGEEWIPRYDNTILHQSLCYLDLLKELKTDFVPEQSEDYCFAYTFGYIRTEEGEQRWPSLRGHESDRIEEMTKELENAKSARDISSKDHRVVQAIVMWSKVYKKDVHILYPQSVNKSWPQFWEFIKIK